MCSVDVVANYVGCSVVAVCYGRFACVTGVGMYDVGVLPFVWVAAGLLLILLSLLIFVLWLALFVLVLLV